MNLKSPAMQKVVVCALFSAMSVGVPAHAQSQNGTEAVRPDVSGERTSDDRSQIPSQGEQRLTVAANRHEDWIADLEGAATSAITVGTLDANSTMQDQAKVEGGATDTSAAVTFDRASYRTGDHGTLQIRVGKYAQGIAATRFGGDNGLSDEMIKIIPLSDVKGLPSEVKFGDADLHFQAVHPGEAKVAVIMPRSGPPKPVANPGTDEVLKQANQDFTNWLSQFLQKQD
jgi:hypothetical protein